MPAVPTARLTVVVPAYNERENIGEFLGGVMAQLGPEDEVVVIDDGSTDGTGEVAAAAGARVLRLEPNRGKGVALRQGFAAATGDYVVTIDADGQDDPAEIETLVAAARAGADLVIGSRFAGHFHGQAISRINKLGTHFFNGLINALYGAGITDSQAGFRCFRRQLLERLCPTASEYEIETEMLVQSLRLGASVVEVPVQRYRRKAGATDFSRVRHGLRILVTILRNLR